MAIRDGVEHRLDARPVRDSPQQVQEVLENITAQLLAEPEKAVQILLQDISPRHDLIGPSREVTESQATFSRDAAGLVVLQHPEEGPRALLDETEKELAKLY